MYNSDTDLLFPPRVIPTLRDLRGKEWRDLIDRVLEQDPTALDRLAFVLFMVRLGGCTSCQADSFRAMQGCTMCVNQTVRRYRGSDHELIKLYKDAQTEVARFLSKE